ncbi:MAG: hypothetical protein VYC02_10235 [SAR324 cluster bacterium]|nr:hypothetical protein [SAR324 cluster bacterium]
MADSVFAFPSLANPERPRVSPPPTNAEDFKKSRRFSWTMFIIPP